MNFQAYKNHARDILASERGGQLLRLDCMNPVKALAGLRPSVPQDPRPSSHGELEGAWRARFGLESASGHVVLSMGVRPLLSRLFALFARDGRHLYAPGDVYPVYLESATAAGLRVTTFPTVPAPRFSVAAPTRQPDVLLVPEPLMPLGRGLDAGELARLSSWLDEDDRRLLVLDSVYTFDTRFTSAAETLLSGGRTVLLHSLSKSFLHPDTAGFAIGPAAVLQTLAHEIGHQALAIGHHVLEHASDVPARLGRMFAERWRRLHAVVGIRVPATGYFGVVPNSFDDLLARGQLAVPGSVFGARNSEWCAVTCLLADFSERPTPSP